MMLPSGCQKSTAPIVLAASAALKRTCTKSGERTSTRRKLLAHFLHLMRRPALRRHEMRDPRHRAIFVFQHVGGLDDGHEILRVPDFAL